MNKAALVVVVMVFLGCSYGKQHVESMLDNPPAILEDSLYADIEASLEELEGRYLRQEISYAQYLEKKKELENRYKYEADRRSIIIEGN